MKTPVLASAVCIASILCSPALAQTKAPGEAVLERIEAKWGGVMTRIRGWNADAMRQFRQGYGDYPVDVLESALAARSFERMMDTLDSHAALRSQQVMEKALSRAHSMAETLPEDANNAQLAEAKGLVAKSLGDDARDLVFIPITPCTVWDTRFATNPDSAGIINNAATKKFYSHLDGAGGSYAAYGGNPSCPETAQNSIGLRPFAVMMTVYINDSTGNGWLTLYRDGDPDPSFATISVYYSPGPTRTQTVISKSSRGYGSGTYDIAATSRFANTHASASITGYFVKVTDAGTVTSIGTGAGLTGGPITTTGTIGLAATNLLPTSACADTNIPRWNGSSWVCSADFDTNSGGTVTSVATGTGLTGGPITASGTINLASTQLLPAAPCAPTQIVRWSGSDWQCSNESGVSGGLSGEVLTGTGAAPAWSNSPFLSGNLLLSNTSGSGVGNILKNGNRFMHNQGTDNTFLGHNAGNFGLSGVSNTGIGKSSLPANSTGNYNTAIGADAMTGNTNGSFNTAIGVAALAASGSGNSNVAIGMQSLLFTNGSFNIAIRGGSNLSSGSNNIFIGNVGGGVESGVIRLGNGTDHIRTYVAGIRGVTTVAADAINVLVDSNGNLGTVSSSRAVKDDIADMGPASGDLMKLRPVTFHYREYGPQSRLQYGLIAEEVDKVYPGLVAKRADGSTETVMYHFLTPMLLNEVQKQQRTIEELKAQVASLLQERAVRAGDRR